MNHGSLFSGIGGFDLAAEWMGWNNLFHCEWNPFGQKVLKHYWPESESFNDITQTDFKKYANRINILTGGFPCQPYSSAGKRKGKDDERHLWPEMLRAIREIRPRWVVGENVLGLVNWSGGLVFHEVQADLEAEGYEVFPFLLPAAAVGAPHRRDRIFFVAYRASELQQRNEPGECGNKRWENVQPEYRETNTIQSRTMGKNEFVTNAESKSGKWLQSKQREHSQQEQGQFRGNCSQLGCEKNAPDTDSKRLEGFSRPIGKLGRRFGFSSTGSRNDEYTTWQNFPTQSPICGGDDGLPAELDGITFSKWRNESIKGYGNAIVPQVVYQIFKAIQEYENQNN